MRRVPLRVNLASIAVRQALVSTTVAAAALAGFGFCVVTVVEQRARADLQHTIDTDIAGLSDVMTAGGVDQLRRRIDDRTDFTSTSTAAAAAFYRLERVDGTRLAGNLTTIPALDPSHSAARVLTVDGMPALVRATRFRAGIRLIVGRSLAPTVALSRQLWRILALIAAATLAASLVVGLIAAGRLARRITRLSATFDRFDHGDMTARTGVAGRDELVRLADHVDTHLAKIQTLFQAQRNISDNIAHELRTPLVHLDARLLTALDDSADPAITEQLVLARADIRSVVALFDALLDIALTESTDGPADAASDINLSELAADVVDLYAASAEEAGIDLSTRIASDVIMRGEAMQMTRLIANLLDNALKYAPPGARVRVHVAAGPRLVVEDDGVGIPTADHHRIFQRFYRSSAAGAGHGLGLALVSVIAARHGLVARVEDAAPGARFIIEAASG